MLVTSKEMLLAAQKGGFAFPAPNFVDQMSIRSYVEVAEKRKIPMMLCFAEAHQEYLSLEEAAALGRFYGEKSNLPLVLHLDHGQKLDTIIRAIELGFTSVMIDASTQPLAENIRLTREVVGYAHSKGVVVEAEIGHVGAGENYENHAADDSLYTLPAEAKQFADETEVDSLAVSIGTVHGVYKAAPKIDFEILRQIKEIVSVPLVLHGGSSTGDQNLARCAREGITKINIFTDLMNAAAEEIKKAEFKNYMEVEKAAQAGMRKCLEHYCEVFGTDKYKTI